MVQNLDNNQQMMMMEDSNEQIVDMKQLPPGFRFDPTDEELVLHFLYSKLTPSPPNSHNNHNHNHLNLNLIIPELEDFYDHYHPCQLHHGEAFESCGQLCFYSKRTDNRVSEYGYWKELVDTDQPIIARNSNKMVGFKKYLLFYHRRSPSSSSRVQTRWLMQEYHAFSNGFGVDDEMIHHRRRSKQPDVNKWVLCRVQQMCDDLQWMTNIIHDQEKYDNEVELSSSDEAVLLAMEDNDDDDDDEISYPY